MSPPRPTRPLRLGEHRFDPALNELCGPAGTQRLPLKQADLLLRLVREPGQPVRRETLLEEVWERRFVNEEVLSRAIADLRAVLGDEAKAPRYIETLPKVGYRFIAGVAEEEPPTANSTAVAHDGHHPHPTLSLKERASGSLPFKGRAGVGMVFALAPTLLLAWLFLRTEAPTPLTPERLLHARPFTSDAGRELFPRFTPDARWVVYTRFVPGGEPAHLRLRAVDGTDDRALVQDESENYCGTVSPDGTQLAWLRTRAQHCELMLRDLRGGPARVLADCGGGSSLGCPDFTRDGRELLLEGDAAQRGLRALALADGALRVLSAPPPGATDLAPRAARDGATLVFWRGDGNMRRPMRMPLAGGPAQPLSDTGYLAFGHAFDRDGTPVTADDRFGQRALVRLGDGTAQLLGGHGARFPDIAANGALVYEAAHYDANLWRVDLRDPAAPPTQLTRAARYDSQPALSPDGQWLAFGSNRDGREGVYLMRADGSEERKLPLDPAQRWTSPAWSADGTQLLVLRYTEREASVCHHTLASAATHCPAGLGRDRNGAFFLEPGVFAPVDETTRDAALWRHAFDGTPDVRIETGGAVDRCRASMRWLACHRPGTAGLWLQDRATGAVREVLPELGPDLRAWDLTDEAVWFPRTGAARGLHRFDLASGTIAKVHDLLPSAIGDALDVAADGSFAVFARTDALDVDLMLLPAAQ